MAEIVATFGTSLQVVTNEYVLNPIMNQFNYLCCYNGNVQSLSDQVEKLNKRRSDLQLVVDQAERNAEVIGSHVKELIEEVEKLSAKKERIIQDRAQVQQGCFYGICPNIKLRYCLSREAKKTAEAAQGLLPQINQFLKTSYRPPHEPIPTPSVGIEVGSRKSKEDEIMEALKDDNVYVIALCGMGGVGKTTMAKKIESKVREGKIFGEVVMTVVSRPLDLKNVQQGIARRLGLELDANDDTDVRAQRLHTRLRKTESVLIILDDVWEKVNLQKIGIPSKTTHRRCKIILTSRIQHVCRNIEDSTKVIQLDALPEQEAWNLFKEKAGQVVDGTELRPIAMDVARECKGLPLALVVVAAALRQSSVSAWKDALRQLKTSLATNIPEVHEEIHVPLKWSYDRLQIEEARYLFLLCCLFPEDFEIRLHRLVEYGFSLRIFANLVNLEEVRNRVCTLVEMLIDRFLLIRIDKINEKDYFMRYRVKMHDVIRDMAISIASKDKHVFMVMHDNIREWPKKDSYDNYTCISLSSDHHIALPENISFPRLELLRVCTNGMEIQESSFDGMRGLKVLHTVMIQSLPLSLSWATNLRSLFLVGCQLKILPNEIGELVNLEILSLYHSRIEMLPKEIGKLKNLRLLDLTECRYLEMIPPGAISGLVQLEELYMMPFDKWKGVEDTNASISEVASLTNLTSLQCQVNIRSINLLQDSGNWHKLTRYNVLIGGAPMKDWGKFDRSVKLHLLELDHLTDLVQVLFDKAQAVELVGSGSTKITNKLSRYGYKNVESLVLRDQDMKFLFDSNSWNLPNTSFLPCLRILVLRSNSALKEICHGQPPTGSFSNLTSITLFRCNGLKNLFCVSVVAMLTMLEFLEIEGCEIIEAVFLEQNRQYGDNAIINTITFPRLSTIRLKLCLSAFCETIDHVAIEFPQLYEMKIQECPRLKSFRTIDRSHLSESEQNVEEQIVFDEKVTCSQLKTLSLNSVEGATELFRRKISIDNFSGLENVVIFKCQKLRSIFSSGMFKGLVNLQDLYLRDCSQLQEIISKDEKEDETSTVKETIFPQLRRLTLIWLPKLIRFCHIKNDLELPSLSRLNIRSCQVLKTFSLGSLHLPPTVSMEGDLSEENFKSLFLSNKQVVNNEEREVISGDGNNAKEDR